jgi:hypothetical protein
MGGKELSRRIINEDHRFLGSLELALPATTPFKLTGIASICYSERRNTNRLKD